LLRACSSDACEESDVSCPFCWSLAVGPDSWLASSLLLIVFATFAPRRLVVDITSLAAGFFSSVSMGAGGAAAGVSELLLAESLELAVAVELALVLGVDLALALALEVESLEEAAGSGAGAERLTLSSSRLMGFGESMLG